MKTFWLSFVDEDKPPGERFLGVAIVDVTDDDAKFAAIEVARLFPHARPGAEWIRAASAKAHRTGCNPGGAMLSTEIDIPADVPRHVLMQVPELQRRGLIDSDTTTH